jgi:hypothetical protein
MIYTQKVVAALERKRAKFRQYQIELQQQEQLLDQWLNQFCAYDLSAMLDQLEQKGVAWPGARPTAELDQATGLCLPFSQRWANHMEARAWALATLTNRPVAAVDGSQITPNRDISVPVGAVQVGWFINRHREGGSYIKDVSFEVLAPSELTDDTVSDNPESTFPNQQVNQLRFVLECEKICELMAVYAVEEEQQRPLFFFDGSFIISFAGQMLPRHAHPYLTAVQHMLDCSAAHRAPLVGFVDSSFSRDLVTLMETLLGQPNTLTLSDAELIRSAGLLQNWGDRTPLFFCARPDALSQEGRASFYADVAFTYIRLASERPPARLEVPRWLVEAGRAEEIIDLVRAECVVGTGYPYAIETADALAVISQQDRQRFHALFEQFAARTGLGLTRARKALSKQSRR